MFIILHSGSNLSQILQSWGRDVCLAVIVTCSLCTPACTTVRWDVFRSFELAHTTREEHYLEMPPVKTIHTVIATSQITSWRCDETFRGCYVSSSSTFLLIKFEQSLSRNFST